jgi:hypothetical protein
MRSQMPVEMSVFVIRIWTKLALKVFLTGMRFEMICEFRFFVEFFLTGFALKFWWLVIDLMTLQSAL